MRTSVVGSTRVLNISVSSVFLIGDSVQITPRNWIIAVQRQQPIFYGKEGNFQAYRLFNVPIPHIVSRDQVSMQRYNPSSFIKVNHIDITSVSASSVYHIGSTGMINSETRIKHIRQIEKLPEED